MTGSSANIQVASFELGLWEALVGQGFVLSLSNISKTVSNYGRLVMVDSISVNKGPDLDLISCEAATTIPSGSDGKKRRRKTAHASFDVMRN